MLDERTILIMMVVLQATMALLAAAVRRGHAEFAAGMGSWAWGVTLISVGSLLTLLSGGELDIGQLALNNAFYISGISLLGLGVRRFLGCPPELKPWLLLTVAVYLIGLGFSQRPEQAPVRIGVFMLQQIGVAGLGLLALYRYRGRHRKLGLVVLAMSLALLALAAGLRGGAALTGLTSVRLLAGSTLVWAVVGAFGLSLVLGTLGMILMAGERTRQRLEDLASHDGLTGLLTRGGFAELASHVLAASRRETRQVAFLIVDIDHFKTVNDSHGHQAGDAVLAAVATVLRSSSREIDLVSRFGGEEFGVLLPQADLEQARQTGERLRRAVEQAHISHAGVRLQATISIGVSAGDARQASIEQLYRDADAALYRAKAKGRNRVECAEPTLSAG